MNDFIINNIELIAQMLGAFLVLIYLIYARQWDKLRSSALSFMLLAQKLMATKEGVERMNWVYAAVWQKLPKWTKSFVTERTLRKKLQEWYNVAKHIIEPKE